MDNVTLPTDGGLEVERLTQERLRREKWEREHDGIVDTYTEDLISDMNQNQWDDENVYDCNPYNDPAGEGFRTFREVAPERE